MYLPIPNKQPAPILRSSIAASIVLIMMLINAFGSPFHHNIPSTTHPVMIPIKEESWRLVANQENPPLQIVEENREKFVKITLNIFHDLNLDGIQGDPELEDNLVRLYNVEDYTDSKLYEEGLITDNRVRLCYDHQICKYPDKHGQIVLLVPKKLFDVDNTIPLTIDFRPGGYVYYTFNQPGTIHGSMEGTNIILTPQFAGSGDFGLPTNRIYSEFTIGFSNYPCVLPFAESVLGELLPMNFYDFNPGGDKTVNFDGEEPPKLADFDPAFSTTFNSRNHTGYDFYYPRKEQIVRYSCLLEPRYRSFSSSENSGNIVFHLYPAYERSPFILGFGHLESPAVNEFSDKGLRFGDAFGVIGDKGTSIIHLHYAFGHTANLPKDEEYVYCAIPPFPYIGENSINPEITYAISKLGEELCFDNRLPTYTVFKQEGNKIYAPFVPILRIGEN